MDDQGRWWVWRSLPSPAGWAWGTASIPMGAPGTLWWLGWIMSWWCCVNHGYARALWLVRVLLLLSASHPLSSFSPPSLLPLAGPRRLRFGTQPGTVPPSSGALCHHQRPPAILCLPLGWHLRPCLVLERKAFPIPPCSMGCHGASGCQGSQGWVPLPSPARPCQETRCSRRVPSVEVAQLERAGVWSRV